MGRQLALTKFDGVVVSFRTKADRAKLAGKRIGFDLASSAMSQTGFVTHVGDRYTVEINASDVRLSDIQQVVLLNDQTRGGKWSAE